MMIKIIKHFVICTLLTGLSFNALAEDFYGEPNNDYFSAYDYSTSEKIWLNNAESWDEDWYKINVTSGWNRVLVDLQFIHSSGDIDVYLTDSSGITLATSNSSTDNEYIEYDVDPAGGIYYIKVVTYNGNYVGNTYNLWWDDIEPTTPTTTDDAYEENDDRLTAYNHTSNEGIWLSDPTLFGVGISSDYDYYEITVTTGYTRVQVELQHTHSQGDLGIELFDASGNSVVWSNGTVDNESIDYDVGTSGTYYILVYNNDGYTGQTYDLWWDDLLATPTTTTDDVYEENDSLSTAKVLTAGTQLSGISNDQDWYKITVASGSTSIQVDLNWTGTADVDLELYDAAGNQLSYSWFGSNVENIDIDVFSAGTYYILVDTYTYSDPYVGANYNLSWSSTTSTVVSGDDPYEQNDTAASAYALSTSDNTQNLGVGISSDEDWYKIDIPAGQRIQVDLLFNDNTNDTDLDLTLFASDGTTVIVGSYSSDSNEAIDFTVTSGGTYYLLVETWIGGSGVYAGTPYDMIYAVIDPNIYDTVDDTTTTSNTKTGLISGGGGGGGGGSLSHVSLLLLPLVTLLRRKLHS